jgi:hypothetical protein
VAGFVETLAERGRVTARQMSGPFSPWWHFPFLRKRFMVPRDFGIDEDQ